MHFYHNILQMETALLETTRNKTLLSLVSSLCLVILKKRIVCSLETAKPYSRSPLPLPLPFPPQLDDFFKTQMSLLELKACQWLPTILITEYKLFPTVCKTKINLHVYLTNFISGCSPLLPFAK